MSASSKSKPSPQNVFFALLPFLVYVITAVLRKLEVISSRNDTILVCNAILFLFAVGAFFITGLPSKAEEDSRLWGLLVNLTFPLAAFLMNTSAFGLAVRRETLLNDLWNWHLGWIICAALQILFLTDLGSGLLAQTKAILLWGEKVISLLGEAISDTLTAIKNANKSAKLTVFVGMVTWVAYNGIQAYNNGISDVFDSDFIWTSTWLWLAVIVVCILIHLVKPVCEKTKESVQNGSTTKNRTLPQTGRIGLLFELLKSTAAAIAFTVLIAMALEILRFLVDAKSNLIPQGMRLLLLYLFGQVITLFLGMAGALFGALNSAIGTEESSDMNRIEMKLKRKLTDALNAQLDNKKNPQESAAVKPEKSKNTHQHTFAAFDEKITKK